ncbi:MHYT domain-containing protein [Pigmentiphaga kullae]|uniref:NO-binding membrane sensor protein with MHYT domain n=1 Tax=Pigmentiphaga kullae TaxID=151784 RepID=A0A4Q7NET3_9BURK|nr:MHYT domain-containing protein [Pigmentiphaga kullae]RZS81641.1 NO-binding membrane sensor protein with MHYT domain [Pigmentiphaga kullae]
MQPGDILPLSFDASLVALSFVISALGAYVALLAASRIRTLDGGVHVGYVIVAGIALGGVGIWSMHFIGMLAQVIPLGVAYGLWLNLLSLVVAVIFAGAALWYVGSAPFSLDRCLTAGVLAGFGVAGMHYIGMGSMRMDAFFDWSIALVLLSVVIAVAAATAAIWLAFNLTSELQRVSAALVMALAVCGMHYTGVAAGTIICSTPRTFTGWQLDGSVLPYAVFLISVVTLVVMRIELHRSSEEVRANAASRVDHVIYSRQRPENRK